MIALAWNAKMSAVAISNAIGGLPTSSTVLKHLQHVEGARGRDADVDAATPTRARIEALQRKMLDDIEYRIQFAEERAAYAREHGNPDAQPSDWFDVLSPKNQAAIASVIKMQDQTDKREGKKATVALDLMKLMGGTPPPSHLIEDGNTIEGEAEDVD